MKRAGRTPHPVGGVGDPQGQSEKRTPAHHIGEAPHPVGGATRPMGRPQNRGGQGPEAGAWWEVVSQTQAAAR